jgi:hypothetical protein
MKHVICFNVEGSTPRDFTAHSYILRLLVLTPRLRKIEFFVTTPYNDDINKRLRNPESVNVKGYVQRIRAATRQD